jgi:hypothetical protein
MIDLNKYRKKIYSQSGEDGIIEKIFEEIGVEKGWYCEFGAGDGHWISNTKNLREKGWDGVLIEGDPKSFENLHKNFSENESVSVIQSYISCEPGECLDDLLSGTKIPKDFDILSIDIDGNDFWIWKSLKNYNPKLVVVEYNSNYNSEDSLVIEYDRNHRFGMDNYYSATVEAFNRLADEKGYSLVAFTPGLNLFFCRKDLADKFLKVNSNDIEKLIVWPPSKNKMSQF